MDNIAPLQFIKALSRMLNPYAMKQKSLPTALPRIAYLAVAAVITVCLALPGCGSGGKKVSATEHVDALLKKGVRPNEMGMVMILEYHRIADRESDYTRSIDNFRKDLESLYQKGFRLVKLNDLLRGRISVPAGTTPIVFSFDDSTEGQFRYIREGAKTRIDPLCAMGMMSDFSRKHPDFGYTALFNYLPELFDQARYKKAKVDYLLNRGFELGDHTITHPSLGLVSDEQVQKEIALPVKDIKKVNPKATTDILCLPHGSIPRNQDLMFDGSYEGTTYHNNWALLVGAEPMYPQYHYKNPGKLLPRVQVMDYDPEDGSGASGSDYWLRYFDRHPELRFVSDGNSKTICAPSYMETRLLGNKLPAGVRFVGY